jgi:hypothetical protein
MVIIVIPVSFTAISTIYSESIEEISFSTSRKRTRELMLIARK